jgi:dihydropyrimidinase
MKTLIKNGRVITAVDDYHADVLVEDERIVLIGESLAHLEPNVDKIIDAKDRYVIPWRHRRSHPHGHALRRYNLGR